MTSWRSLCCDQHSGEWWTALVRLELGTIDLPKRLLSTAQGYRYDEVCLTWFVEGREQRSHNPPYDQLIVGYDTMEETNTFGDRHIVIRAESPSLIQLRLEVEMNRQGTFDLHAYGDWHAPFPFTVRR